MSPPSRPRVPLRLQDLVCAGMVLLFAAAAAWTGRHLHHELQRIRRDAAEAERAYRELSCAAPAPTTGELNRLDERIAALERQLAAVLPQHDALQRAAAQWQAELRLAADALARRKADYLGRGLAFDEQGGIFTIEAEPDPWGPDVAYAAWWDWRARKQLVDEANQALTQARVEFLHRKRQGEIAAEQAAAAAARVAGAQTAVEQLRTSRNGLILLLSQPQRLEELRRAASGWRWESVLAVILHTPFLLACCLYAVSFSFRLMVLREWLSGRRVVHAL